MSLQSNVVTIKIEKYNLLLKWPIMKTASLPIKSTVRVFIKSQEGSLKETMFVMYSWSRHYNSVHCSP